MTGSRFAHLEFLTGAVSVALLFAAAVLVGIYDYLPPGGRLAEFLAAHSTRVSVGGYIGGLGGASLIWFAGVLRSILRGRERGSSRYSAVSYGGGMAAGVALILGFAVLSLAGARAGAAAGISVEEAATLYDVWSGFSGLALPLGLAVFVGAATIAGRQSALFPSWSGWVGAVVAIGCASPFGYLAQTLGVIWVLVVSVWLYARRDGILPE